MRKYAFIVFALISLQCFKAQKDSLKQVRLSGIQIDIGEAGDTFGPHHHAQRTHLHDIRMGFGAVIIFGHDQDDDAAIRGGFQIVRIHQQRRSWIEFQGPHNIPLRTQFGQ